ncbi:MAG TPA: hypothetical protein VFQ79_07970 [Bryobacteraceae bacterium]|nr:hypothetical protein [Bryobacteraceae bacterium]
MRFWYLFWVVTFAISAVAFAAIAAVVAVRGVGDLRQMLAALKDGADKS